MAPITVRVPATSANLGPGFDTLGLALGLFNILTLQEMPRDGLEVDGEGTDELDGKTDTIAHQAAYRVFQKLRYPVQGVHLQLRNAIPFSRGLGSSSAAIVAGLVAANHWCSRETGRSLEQPELLALATEIEGHPDNVAPALLGGLVIAATDESGRVTAVQLPVPRFPRLVVWVPEARLATRTARGVLPENLSRADAVFNVSRAALLVGALAAHRWDALPEALRDKIHQNQRASLIPGWEPLTQAAAKCGALGATLSGAGPAIIFWLLPEMDEKEIVEVIHGTARQHGIEGQAMPLEVEPEGCRIVG